MNILPGQILFIAILGFLVLYIFLLRTAHTDRIVYILFALVGILLVLAPSLSTDIAHLLGIGRGVDLVIYIFILAGLFYSVTITSELKRLQRQMTTLVRQNALDNPRQGEAGPQPASAVGTEPPGPPPSDPQV
ncbi:MAG TPA: DUF2304 domain-containing protein [Anaerolineales bacterium]